METWVYLFVVSFLAGFIQGLTGFGSVLLSLPLLAIFLAIKTVIPLTALFAVALTVFIIIEMREHWEWKPLCPLLIGSLPGIPIGVYMLEVFSADTICRIIGAVLIIYSGYSLIFRPFIKKLGFGWASLFGFISGCLGGAVSASGPPVIIYTSLQPWNKDKIKIVLQGYFLISGTIVVLMQTLQGITTGSVYKLFLVSLPFLAVGTYAGSFFYGKIREDRYRAVLHVLLVIMGIFLIVKDF